VNFDTNIHCQQAPFSGAVSGEQAIEIQSSITFCEYFSVFLLIFFASLKYGHPQKKKNQSNLVSINPNFSFLDFCFIANPNQRWLATSPRNPNFLVWMIQENFTGKGDVQHKLKGRKP
jgi:hypothetical protein